MAENNGKPGNGGMNNFEEWFNNQFKLTTVDKMMPMATAIMASYQAFQRVGFDPHSAFKLAKAVLMASVSNIK